jgi:hypothetical protein
MPRSSTSNAAASAPPALVLPTPPEGLSGDDGEGTVDDLCTAYIEHLRLAKKSSAKNVEDRLR